jgi:selenocysteine-specific elongation factor
VRLETPAVLTRGDRFILRAYSPPVTIGGGAVLDPMPARGGIRTPAARSRFALLDPGTRAFADGLSMRAAIEQALGERGSAGVAVRELVSRMGCAPEDVESAIEGLRGAGRAERLGDVLVGSEVLERLGAQLLEALGEYHRAEAHSDGLPREEARVRLFGRAHPAVFERVVRHLADRGAVVARDRLALTTHRVSLAPEEADALRIVEDVFLRAGLRPPDPSALAVETGLGQPALDRALRVLQRQRTIVRLETLWFHAGSLAKLKGEIVALKRGSAEARLDVAAFKQLYGVSRKYAIPLLEYLDRERVTRRVGETRVVL